MAHMSARHLAPENKHAGKHEDREGHHDQEPLSHRSPIGLSSDRFEQLWNPLVVPCLREAAHGIGFYAATSDGAL